MPVPVTKEPVKVRLLPRSSAPLAGTTGKSASTETPQAAAWFEV